MLTSVCRRWVDEKPLAFIIKQMFTIQVPSPVLHQTLHGHSVLILNRPFSFRAGSLSYDPAVKSSALLSISCKSHSCFPVQCPPLFLCHLDKLKTLQWLKQLHLKKMFFKQCSQGSSYVWTSDLSSLTSSPFPCTFFLVMLLSGLLDSFIFLQLCILFIFYLDHPGRDIISYSSDSVSRNYSTESGSISRVNVKIRGFKIG